MALVRHPSATWFGGDTGALEPDEVVFADEVRRRAGRLAPRVAPADTWAVDTLGGCLLITRLPDVPSGETPVSNNHLQVMYRGGTLNGYWGCSHYWDEFDPTDLDALVANEVGGPLAAAALAIDWIDRQVRRPLVRREWRGLLGVSTA